MHPSDGYRETTVQHPVMPFVMAPAADGRPIPRLADLLQAGAGDRALALVKAQATLVPGQSQEIEQARGLRFGSGNNQECERRRALPTHWNADRSSWFRLAAT